MKTIQSFLFLFAFVAMGSLVEAQTSITYLNKGIFGDERIKVVFADADASMCEASLFWHDFLNDDYVKMKTKSCNDLGNGVYELKLADADGKIYKGKYSTETGFVLTYESGAEFVFGHEFALKTGKNKFTMIIAGANSYFAFTVPGQELNETAFVLTSKSEGKKFSKQFNQFIFGEINTLEFSIEPELNFDEETARIKMSQPDEDTFIVEFTYKGKSTFFTVKQ
jgi:hypothetical protein